MVTKHSSYRISDEGKQTIKLLSKRLGINEKSVIELAVRELEERTRGIMSGIRGNVIEQEGDFTMTIDGIVARVYDGKKEIFSSGDHGEAEERFVEEATTRDLLSREKR